MSRSWPAFAALLLNAFIFGVSWWPFRELDSRGLHSLWATAFSYSLVVLGLLILRPGAVRQVLANKSLLLLFVAAGLTNSAFNWGVLIGDVIRVVLLFYLMPVWAILLGRWVLGEPITVASVVRMAMAVTGACLVLYEPGSGMPVPQSLGDWLGLFGGFWFAVTNITLKHQSHSPTEAKMLAMFAGGTAIPALLALGLMTVDLVPAPGAPLAWLPGLLLFAAVMIVANLCLQFGTGRLPANVTAVVMLSEVLFAAASAALLGSGIVTTQTLLGGLLIILASLAATLWGKPARTGPPS
ncbi:MAG: EamA family transporter [Burkholderiaceae bacterium]